MLYHLTIKLLIIQRTFSNRCAKPTFQIEVQFLESDEEGVPGHGEEDPRSVAEGHPPHGGAPRVDRQCKKTIKGDRRLPKIS